MLQKKPPESSRFLSWDERPRYSVASSEGLRVACFVFLVDEPLPLVEAGVSDLGCTIPH
jgi:hypothetical protein